MQSKTSDAKLLPLSAERKNYRSEHVPQNCLHIYLFLAWKISFEIIASLLRYVREYNHLGVPTEERGEGRGEVK
jgi:hypothetical protein